MEEKLLKTKKNGMAVLLLVIAAIAADFALVILSCTIWGTAEHPFLPLFIPALILLCVSWILFLGFKVLKPQEALVLTLFGEYIGTIREPGFYFVNPFCVAVNPAAKTRLGQSGDVDGGDTSRRILIAAGAANQQNETVSKKISMKAMTLSNARQKVNDVLGNPVEIGVAVIWRVKDTAAAVFNVDNYKEYLSLQCDSAVRDIVKIYPYDVAPGVDTTGDGHADDGSLRGSTTVVAGRIGDMSQEKVQEAGLEIIEARIT